MTRKLIQVTAFVLSTVVISISIAQLVPPGFFYSMANILNISGDEDIIDFMIYSTIGVSVAISIIIVWAVSSIKKS